MIVKEFFRTREDGVSLYKSYSDTNKCIRKVGTKEVYAEAIDVENANFEYEETDKVIEKIEDVKNYDYKSGYSEKLML